MATNAGRVVLARQLKVRGNMVIIDHGGGLFSGLLPPQRVQGDRGPGRRRRRHHRRVRQHRPLHRRPPPLGDGLAGQSGSTRCGSRMAATGSRGDRVASPSAASLLASPCSLLPSPVSLYPPWVQLWLEVEGDPGRFELPGGGSELIAFMSFAVSRGFGATHPLIALADRLHDEHKVRMGPLTTFYEAEAEDAEDREKLELALQDPAPLAAELREAAARHRDRPGLRHLRTPRRFSEHPGAGPRPRGPARIALRRRHARPPGLRPVMRRRRAAITAREGWVSGAFLVPRARPQLATAHVARDAPRAAHHRPARPLPRPPLPRYRLRHGRLRRPDCPTRRTARTARHTRPGGRPSARWN